MARSRFACASAARWPRRCRFSSSVNASQKSVNRLGSSRSSLERAEHPTINLLPRDAQHGCRTCRRRARRCRRSDHSRRPRSGRHRPHRTADRKTGTRPPQPHERRACAAGDVVRLACRAFTACHSASSTMRSCGHLDGDPRARWIQPRSPLACIRIFQVPQSVPHDATDPARGLLVLKNGFPTSPHNSNKFRGRVGICVSDSWNAVTNYGRPSLGGSLDCQKLDSPSAEGDQNPSQLLTDVVVQVPRASRPEAGLEAGALGYAEGLRWRGIDRSRPRRARRCSVPES